MSVSLSLESLYEQLKQADKAREQGKFKEAEHMLDSIVATCESNMDNAGIKALYAGACQIYATRFSDEDNLTNAEEWALKAQRITAGLGGSEEGKSKILLANIHRKQGQYETAISEFAAGIALVNPTSLLCADALGGMAHANIALGNIDEAIKHRENALRIALDLNNNVAIGIFRGDLAKDYFFAGHLNDADAMIQMALPYVDPDHPRCGSYSHKVSGDILLAQGKVEDARKAYKIAATTDNQNPQNNNYHCIAMALTGLGWLELRSGEFSNAKGHFEQALSATHEDKALKTECMAGMAAALWGCGQREEANVLINEAANEEAARTNLYVKGHVNAVLGAFLSKAEPQNAPKVIAFSDEAFAQSAKPLVGLGKTLVTALTRSAAPPNQQLG